MGRPTKQSHRYSCGIPRTPTANEEPRIVTTAETTVLSAQIASELRNRILTGVLKPGTRIRQEELADDFGS
ncbi:MAG: GntR family transcriptional regulator, partial [Agromyces sp.]